VECHGESKEVVRRLLEDLKAGVVQSNSHVAVKDGRILLIRYTAIRDQHNAYRGVMESVMDIGRE